MNVNQQANVSITSPVVQNARAVVMVPPKEFGFNAQTAQDNAFQNPLDLSGETILQRAMAEFNAMVSGLRQAGVEVVVFDYPLTNSETPDAVFPNNWFSTTEAGEMFLFPMACANRRLEVRPQALVERLQQHGFAVIKQHSLLAFTEQQAFLESTGVMVIDHPNRTIYAGLSQRCDREVLEVYAEQIGYSRVVSFQTRLPSGSPIYHTNVMMAIGERFCVICDEAIPEYERSFVVKSLAKDKQVISISIEQMNRFCGNILQLETRDGQKVIAMSQSAYEAFTPAQLNQLATHGKLLPFSVPTIETIGGGSVRCMLAELFLPKQR
ncbi:arginine deiminase-related protein [Vibrio mimicus]|uniref:citrulline utilization hydrolase CtlX n=1 Tax=Vibrio mimicus TaxID=674 RepID=UPI002F929FA1